MEEQLLKLGFNQKEVKVYLALLEFGNQPASLISKKTGFPKATVLFLFQNLLKKGFITKSQKGKVQYFYADPKDLKKATEKRIQEEQKALKDTIPLLEEFKNPFTSPPKLSFFEGLEGCRKAYNLITESKTEAYEFASHNDLEKMGEQWMQDFIKRRSKNKVFLHTIAKKNPVHLAYKKKDKAHQRKQCLYPAKLGDLHSSIAIFEDKVLLLNLYNDPFAILIESPQVAETLKTIHKLAWKD